MENKISNLPSSDGYIAKLEAECEEMEEKISGYTREIGQHIVKALGADWKSYFQQETSDSQKMILNNEVAGEISEHLSSISCLQQQLAELNQQMEMLKNLPHCPQCGLIVEADAVFCKYCGCRIQSLSEKTCVKCGFPIEKDALFCTNCGSKI